MAIVDLKPAHRELTYLLKQLTKKNVAGLKKGTSTATILSENPFEWLFRLRLAKRELEHWCELNSQPQNEFFIDVSPLPSARGRSGRRKPRARG